MTLEPSLTALLTPDSLLLTPDSVTVTTSGAVHWHDLHTKYNWQVQQPRLMSNARVEAIRGRDT